MKRNRFLEEGFLGRLFTAPFSRKGFLKFLGLSLTALVFSHKSAGRALAKTGERLMPRPKKNITTDYDLAVAKGSDPAAATRQAIAALGGIGRFVKPGDVVVVKPNIGWDRTPEQAGNTNPEVVAAIVALCKGAGARSVKVFDNTCADARRTYRNSGIEDAVKKAGGLIYHISDWKFYPGSFPQGSIMQDWPLFRDAVMCDCFINVPVAKHHSLSRLTLSMKNFMGICGGDRGEIHRNIDRRLVELTAFMKPELTIVDAWRILLRHGPTGGKLSDVEEKRTIIASADPVMADAYAATLFGIEPNEIGAIRLGAEAGLGRMDFKRARMKEITA